MIEVSIMDLGIKCGRENARPLIRFSGELRLEFLLLRQQDRA